MGKKLGFAIILLLAFVLSISAVVRYFVLDPVETNAILIREGMEMFAMNHQLWNIALYIHILTAFLPLIIGPFLFVKKLRNKYLQGHRYAGKVYVVMIIISSLVGIYLAFYAHGGILAILGFLCLDILWFYTTWKAYKYIRNKQQSLHEEWMYRSYAMTFAALTFRMWSAIVGYSLDNFTVGYVAAIWLSWVGNLVAIEIWIRFKLRKGTNISGKVTTKMV
ncbi:DUF2306 domain-containing protein [Bacillus luteolus]|uniref:DUF2306 domain-containing protein n=1 Tax=Litchfieldia luteola TaxID=682179 RepID=A0ABR9QMF1_9BACI|nr:DUF2306 domain-containing protein [Cytobacillus luteolus]MBE4909624.1 DUF2306 domain-containing protein [Cytobacillus luteolus]MBP1941025.1 hypothetical protein [Cytobacillus luteolus]